MGIRENKLKIENSENKYKKFVFFNEKCLGTFEMTESAEWYFWEDRKLSGGWSVNALQMIINALKEINNLKQ